MKALTINAPTITETAAMAINAIGFMLLLDCVIFAELETFSDSKLRHRMGLNISANNSLRTKNINRENSFEHRNAREHCFLAL